MSDLIAKLQRMNVQLLNANGWVAVHHKDIPASRGYCLFAPIEGDNAHAARILTDRDTADLTPCIVLKTSITGKENDLFIRYPVMGEVIDAILFLESLPLPVSAHDKVKEWESQA